MNQEDLDKGLDQLESSLNNLSLEELKERKTQLWDHHQKLKTIIIFKEEMKEHK